MAADIDITNKPCLEVEELPDLHQNASLVKLNSPISLLLSNT